jgi:phage-related minor tail protein
MRLSTPPVKNAKGNIFGEGSVFNPGALEAYRNEIVNSPTYFAFAHGAGLMGEAGPEAIMPLERDRRGRLGVSIADSYVPRKTENRIVVESHTHLTYAPSQGGDPAEAQRMMGQLERVVTEKTKAAVKEVIIHESRPGGLLSRH